MQQAAKRFFIFPVVVLSILATGCGATPIDVVDPSLTGDWQGVCEVGLPIVFDPTQLPDDAERTRSTVTLKLTIRENAVVDGDLGAAQIEEAVLKRNRGELGRSLNVASDYIIIDGYLVGAIVSGEDETESKSFTIPFDLVDNRLQGGLMWRQAGKYPYPLCSVDLERTP